MNDYVPPYRLLRTLSLAVIMFNLPLSAQLRGPDAAPGLGLWRSQPDYETSYQVADVAEIQNTLERVTQYLESTSPIRWVDLDTGNPIPEGSLEVAHPGLEFGLFALISYEWGVTYAGMLRAAEVTGQSIYRDYVQRRFEAIERIAHHYLAMPEDQRPRRYLIRGLINPHNLDQCGSMTAALIKGQQAGVAQNLLPIIEPAISYIQQGEKRLEDGTFARDRPLPDSLWLDDLYMSVPALAQWAVLSADHAALDDACQQMLGMTQRMFEKSTGLYRHGWVKAMQPHPSFPWGRANGWTIMAMTELLSVLPEDHAQHARLLEIYRAHVQGIARHQGINGFWHQLMDRPETYEETSATAMFVFALARGINRGWLDPSAYGPVATLGWHAVSSAVDAEGAVQGTCVGTGMAWDPAFYAYRPVSPHAAHGYGPVLLAGAEMIAMMKEFGELASFHDSAVHFGETPNW